MFRFVCVVLMAVAVCADKIEFKDCGHKEVKEIDVTKCSGELCVLHKGEEVTFDVHFVANQDTKAAKINLIAKIGDLEIEIPGVDTDACHFAPCPMTKGDTVELKYKITIPAVAPDVEAMVTAKLMGDNGEMACATVHGKIEE